MSGFDLDQGAELAAVKNDTGRSETETASIWRFARDAACFAVWRASDVNLSHGHERMIEAATTATLRAVVDLLEKQANEGYAGEDVDGDFLAAQRVRELLGLPRLQFPDHQPLAALSLTTEVSSAPAASPAQKKPLPSPPEAT